MIFNVQLHICTCMVVKNFHTSHTLTQGGGAGRVSRDGRESTKNILENMPELWDEELYKSEYDLS